MRWEPEIRTLLLVSFALALLAPLLYATAPPPSCKAAGEVCGMDTECCSVNCEFNRCGPSKPWHEGIYVWVGLAVIISAAVIGLAYMAAQLFQIRVMDAWAKIELQELASGVIIAVFCIAFVASVNASAAFLISPKIAGTPPPNVGEMAKGAISNIYADGAQLYKKLGEAYFNVARVASYSYTVGISAWYVSTSISSSPAQGLYPLASEIGGAMDSVGTLLLFLAAQQSFIVFFINASQVMLPVGIFLRCFSLSRKVGGVVLAAVIASSVIYPAAFAVSNEVYSVFQQDLQDNVNGKLVRLSTPPYTLVRQGGISVWDPGNPPLTGLVCSPQMQRFIESPLSFIPTLIPGGAGGLAGEIVAVLLGGETGWQLTICAPACALAGTGYLACYNTCSNIVEKVYVGVKSAFPLLMAPYLMGYSLDLSGQDLHDWYFDNMQNVALPAAAKFGVLALVFSLLPIIIAMAMLRNLAITFGGEPQLYGISRMI